MDRIKDRDLTSLNFLVDSLVGAPTLAEKLTNIVLDDRPTPELQCGVEALKKELMTEFPPGQPLGERAMQRLRNVAATLMKSVEEPVRSAGRALARAIEHVVPPRARRSRI